MRKCGWCGEPMKETEEKKGNKVINKIYTCPKCRAIIIEKI